MFSSLISPLQTTLLLFIIYVTLSFKFSKNRKHKLLNFVLAVILFVPVFLGTNYLFDLFRFGKFEYETVAQIDDSKIKLPESSKNIVVHKTSAYHVVKFESTQENVNKWIESQWLNWEASAVNKQESPETEINEYSVGFYFKEHFPELNVLKIWQGPVAPNGAGWKIYQSNSTTFVLTQNYW